MHAASAALMCPPFLRSPPPREQASPCAPRCATSHAAQPPMRRRSAALCVCVRCLGRWRRGGGAAPTRMLCGACPVACRWRHGQGGCARGAGVPGRHQLGVQAGPGRDGWVGGRREQLPQPAPAPYGRLCAYHCTRPAAARPAAARPAGWAGAASGAAVAAAAARVRGARAAQAPCCTVQQRGQRMRGSHRGPWTGSP